MENPDLNHHSLSHVIAEKITKQIMTGELEPGDKVVETVYADEYGISRAPVREALYLLTIEGIIERIPRKGAVVKGFTKYELYDLLEIRMMLENLAMKRISSQGPVDFIVDKMEQLLPLMKQVEDDNTQYAQLNQKFHMYIVEMSQSETIKNMYSRLGIQLLTLQTMSFIGEENILKSMEEHHCLVDMFKKGKVDEAQELLETHNLDVTKRVEKALQSESRD